MTLTLTYWGVGTTISLVRIMATSEASKHKASKLMRFLGVEKFIFQDSADQACPRSGPMTTHSTSVVSQNKKRVKVSVDEKHLALAAVTLRIIHR